MAVSGHDLKNLPAGILLLAERIALESRPLEIGIDVLAYRILEVGRRMQQNFDSLTISNFHSSGAIQFHSFLAGGRWNKIPPQTLLPFHSEFTEFRFRD